MTIVCASDGSATHAEATVSEFAARSNGYKYVVAGEPHVLVWCNVHGRRLIPVVLLPDPVVITMSSTRVPSARLPSGVTAHQPQALALAA